MKSRRNFFDDPKDLRIWSTIAVETILRIELMDFSARSYQRKGDKKSLRRSKEIKKVQLAVYGTLAKMIPDIIDDQIIRTYALYLMHSKPRIRNLMKLKRRIS